MKILHYTQHILGIGHLFRSLAIDQALAPATVHLTTGGPAVPLQLPGNVRHHPMPALKMDSEFKAIQSVDGTDNIEAIWQEREKLLMHLFLQLQPDVLLIEMFPFGRKRFSRELLPVLEANRNRKKPATVLCSLRDILVEKEDQSHFEAKVLKWLNPFFDGVLVHSDPTLITLDRTFSRVKDIACPIWYTGYVAEGPSARDQPAARRLLSLDQNAKIILVSAGSGSVGQELLTACIEASILLSDTLPHQLRMFTGPHAEGDLRQRLLNRARNYRHLHIDTFTSQFPDYVLACDLSISMAGYNTTMNLLASRKMGLMYPFDQNREQRMRLTALADRGHLAILGADDLPPERLALIIKKNLLAPVNTTPDLKIQGDLKSAEIIFRLIEKGKDI